MTVFRAAALAYGAICMAAGAVLAWLVFTACEGGRRYLGAVHGC